MKQASRLYQAFKRSDLGLKSKPMTGHMPGLCLKKMWQAKLRPCKAQLGLAYSHPTCLSSFFLYLFIYFYLYYQMISPKKSPNPKNIRIYLFLIYFIYLYYQMISLKTVQIQKKMQSITNVFSSSPRHPVSFKQTLIPCKILYFQNPNFSASVLFVISFEPLAAVSDNWFLKHIFFSIKLQISSFFYHSVDFNSCYYHCGCHIHSIC